jgi:hypothetical protein
MHPVQIASPWRDWSPSSLPPQRSSFIESRWPPNVVKLRNEMLEQTRRQGK